MASQGTDMTVCFHYSFMIRFPFAALLHYIIFEFAPPCSLAMECLSKARGSTTAPHLLTVNSKAKEKGDVQNCLTSFVFTIINKPFSTVAGGHSQTVPCFVSAVSISVKS